MADANMLYQDRSADLRSGTLAEDQGRDPYPARAARILLAEDNDAFAQVTKFNLERAGYEVTTVSDGREAWQALQQEAFDLLISDEQMPEMSGTELCARMRTMDAFRPTPVILLTAKCLELDHRGLQSELDVALVLSKPFSPRQLVGSVRQALAASRGSG